jgi:hypothetical protein
MIVNGTCINKQRKSVGGAFINAWTGVSSLVAVIWLARSMYKQRQFSQPKFLSLAVCLCDFLFAGEYSKAMEKKIKFHNYLILQLFNHDCKNSLNLRGLMFVGNQFLLVFGGRHFLGN